MAADNSFKYLKKVKKKHLTKPKHLNTSVFCHHVNKSVCIMTVNVCYSIFFILFLYSRFYIMYALCTSVILQPAVDRRAVPKKGLLCLSSHVFVLPNANHTNQQTVASCC